MLPTNVISFFISILHNHSMVLLKGSDTYGTRVVYSLWNIDVGSQKKRGGLNLQNVSVAICNTYIMSIFLNFQAFIMMSITVRADWLRPHYPGRFWISAIWMMTSQHWLYNMPLTIDILEIFSSSLKIKKSGGFLRSDCSSSGDILMEETSSKSTHSLHDLSPSPRTSIIGEQTTILRVDQFIFACISLSVGFD